MKDYADQLVVSFLFPPSGDVSGINVFKRIIDANRPVDVLQKNYDDSDFTLPDNGLIRERILIDMDRDDDSADCIFEFITKSLKAIKKDYSRIYSRSWYMANHFLAFEYCLSNDSAFWTAEFSDPLMFNISNKRYTNKKMTIDNKGYIDKINTQIKLLNEKTGNDFPAVENGDLAFFITEYLVYLFADEIIFTNQNQREIMLDQFPVDVKDFVLQKSRIMPHPTLPESYYHLEDAKVKLDDDLVNIAYFGSDYYGKRHFEGLFYALEALNHKYKDRLRLHIFINNKKILKKLISSLECKNLIKIRKPLPYIRFLNATTMFDVLIVNDLFTRGNFKVNPYLPSKVSDYRGSMSYIWAISEMGSVLSNLEGIRFKSDIHDYESSAEALVEILAEHGFCDDDFSFDDDYFINRLTTLNELYEKEFRRNAKLKKELKQLKSKKRFRFF